MVGFFLFIVVYLRNLGYAIKTMKPSLRYSFFIKFKGVGFQVYVYNNDSVAFEYMSVVDEGDLNVLKYYLEQEGFLDKNTKYKIF